MSDKNDTMQNCAPDPQELLAAAERFAREVAAAYARLLNAVGELFEALCEALPVLIDPVINEIRRELERARAKEAAQRRREGRAAKPRPPIRKKLRTFRCRSCC